MVGGLERIETQLVSVVADLNPSSVHSSSVVGLIEAFDRIERLASGAKTLLARRIEDTVGAGPAGGCGQEVDAARAQGRVAADQDGCRSGSRDDRGPDPGGAVCAHVH